MYRGQQRKVKGMRAGAGGKQEKKHEIEKRREEEEDRKRERQMGDQVKRTFAERQR